MEAWNFIINVLGEIPVLGDILNGFFDLTTNNGSEVLTLKHAELLISSMGNSIVETFIVAACIVVFEELKKLLSLKGMFVFAIIAGATFGSILITVFKHSINITQKTIVLLLLIALESVLLVVNKVKSGKIALGFSSVFTTVFIKNMLLGFEAFIAGYLYFYSCCLLVFVNNGISGIEALVKMIIIPSIIMFALLFFEYLFKMNFD